MGTETKSELEQIREDINTLRTELNKINEERRKWSGQQKELYDAITGFLQSIRDHKKKRNSLTGEVKKLKEERDALNEDISKRISEIKKMRDDKLGLIKQYNLKEDPIKIRREIEAMERKIETEAISFEKEKKLMKLINSKKKELGNVSMLDGVGKEISGLSKEIDKLKQVAKEKHDLIQKKAEDSQKHHEAILEIGKQLDEIKSSKKESLDKVLEFQTKFDEINSSIEEKILLLKSLSEKVKSERMERAAVKKEEIEKILQEKEVAVEEKIKTKKKLTTEDLLIFQRKKA